MPVVKEQPECADSRELDKPVLVCPADLTHLPETRSLLESVFAVRYVEPTEAALAEHLPAGMAYYASLHVRLTRSLLANAPRLKAAATPSTGLDHFDLDAMQQRGVAVLSLKDDRVLLDQERARRSVNSD